MNYIRKKIADENIDLYESSISYFKIGKYDNAVNILLSLIEKEPDFVEAYNSIGLNYKKIGDFDNSLKYYNKSIEVYFQTIYQYLVNNNVQDINYDYVTSKSKTWTKVVIEIAVKNASMDGIKNLKFPDGDTAKNIHNQNPFAGLVFYQEGDTRLILPSYFASYYKILKSDILYSTILNNIGTLFAEYNDYDQAKKCFQESIEFTPEKIVYDAPIIGLSQIE